MHSYIHWLKKSCSERKVLLSHKQHNWYWILGQFFKCFSLSIMYFLRVLNAIIWKKHFLTSAAVLSLSLSLSRPLIFDFCLLFLFLLFFWKFKISFNQSVIRWKKFIVIMSTTLILIGSIFFVSKEKSIDECVALVWDCIELNTRAERAEPANRKMSISFVSILTHKWLKKWFVIYLSSVSNRKKYLLNNILSVCQTNCR